MNASLICYFVYVLAVSTMVSVSSSSLKIGFYRSTCPSAESIVRRVVKKAISKDPGMAAGLIRLPFHDCFVRGCDASVLLNSTLRIPAEKDSPINAGLRGFEVIDEAKAQLEAHCPQVVSCADIITFAARDSVYSAGGIKYAVPAGRRDGCISLVNDTFVNLMPPSFNAKQLEDSFAKKGLSLDEMVTLSGAHSIGVSPCRLVSERLYTFNLTHPQDPSMDRKYAKFLKTKCPPPSPSDGDRPSPKLLLDVVTPNKLDNTYYKELSKHRGLLTSDQTLFSSPSTRGMVKENILHPELWGAKFALAMIRMGSIDVLTGTQGEIRKNCNFLN